MKPFHLQSDFNVNLSKFLRSGSYEDGSTSSSGESSGESSSGESNERPGVGHVTLSVSTLQSMHAMSSLNTEEMSAFAQQGISRQRIRAILKSKVCPCSCALPEKDLIQVCEYFWRLPKIAQDAVLWSIQAECSQRRRQWYLQGPTRSCYPLHFFIDAGR